ncbi:VWA domain-containing protein [Mesorhizobium sp. LHD-90]|uniref:VWA domain-containing protein n=1 Tax=Mesorhizobium sp. LHD-90 TaxID=3071414 RepID=UPI0027E12BC7|nr:VWA domain-containing protein [Mesorhizobium sp. LHD-90]MDQ6437751.1 VWA domain-containing protein [Mesorhizobium sp. LHD-90]
MAKDSLTTGSGRSVERSGSREIDDFVRLAKTVAAANGPAKGRLILALDATMSRQPTWDLACRLQGEMFDAAGKAGGLAVQLVYFRGFSECRASAFVRDTGALKDLMTRIDCRAGHTQLRKILSHALKETAHQKVDALVFIGDAFEEEIDRLAELAGKLGLRGVPVFVFQEGNDAAAEAAFREIARLTKGAWFRFDRSAAAKLAKLLASVAVFAAGGLKALEARNLPEDRLLIEHLRSGGGR